MPDTVEDFWQMIWDQKVKTIVMLTKLMEGDKPKCEQYWPDKVGDNINPKPSLEVTYANLQMFADYQLRTLQVKSVRMLLYTSTVHLLKLLFRLQILMLLHLK